METKVCEKCGKTVPVETFRFVKVNVSATQSTSYSGRKQITTTTTYEQFDGVCRADFCADCIKKKRLFTAIEYFVIGLVAGFGLPFLIFLLFSGKDFFNSNAGTLALISLGIGLVGGIIGFAVGMKEQAAFLAGSILDGKRKGTRHIPVAKGIYDNKQGTPALDLFTRRSSLKTNVGLMIFSQFIATGLGDILVDTLLAKETASPDEKVSEIVEKILAQNAVSAAVAPKAAPADTASETPKDNNL